MKNSLNKINFKTIYYDSNDVKEFYSESLKCAKIYKRISAYFTTGIFKYLSKGIPEFIENDGYMQLIITKDVDKEVINMINDGYALKNNKDFVVNNQTIKNEVNKLCNEKDLSIFSYMIAIGKLDVRIVYKLKGIVHDKFGIISDYENTLAYVGSNNFTEQSLALNDESFQVTIDWDDPSKRELETITELNDLFDKFWNNKRKDVVTIELPDDVITQMVNDIDWNEIRKSIDNYDYIRFNINENREVELVSNLDLSECLIYKNIGDYSNPLFMSYDSPKYLFKNIGYTSEIFELKNLIKKMCDKLNISLYLTKNANDFFDIKYRDYNNLLKRGIEIKSDDFFKTSKFQFYKEHINNIVRRPLKDKQIQAASHIIEMERSLNFSVPGSGKTATVLGAFEYLNSLQSTNKNFVNKILVIGPKNCSKSWCDEYREVSIKGTDHIPLCLINNDGINEKIDVLEHDYSTSRLIIINYEIVSKLKESLLKLVDKNTFIVFDEIHRIKRIDSAKYHSLMEVSAKTRYRVALTGTPLPNGYIDLYNMINLLHEDYTKTYFGMYESDLKYDDNKFRKTGLQNESLNEILNPFFIRVTKEDLNVPLAEPDHLIEINANEYEKEKYFDIKNCKYGTFEETVKLVEIGCVPFKIDQAVDDSDKITLNLNDQNIDERFMTSKLHKFISIVKENKRKCVVWCQFVDTIKLVTFLLKKEGFKVESIYGETEQSERDRIIDCFNYGSLEIIVTNPATLAESVSLHKTCHDAHYLELSYNLYQYLQSRDRIHRLGLKEDDETNYYIYLNFYDSKMELSKDFDIYKSLKKKEELMKKSVKNGNFIFGDNDYLLD